MTREMPQIRQFVELAILELETGGVEVTRPSIAQFSFALKGLSVSVWSNCDVENNASWEVAKIDGVDLVEHDREQLARLFTAAAGAFHAQEKRSGGQKQIALVERLGAVLAGR